MRTLQRAFALAVLTSLVACGQPVDPAADRAAVRNVGARATKALNSGDVDALVSLLREDVFFMYQDGPILVGRQQVRAQLKPLTERVSFRLSRQDERIMINGDWAFYRSILTGTMTLQTGVSKEIRTEGVDILKREPDDSWKYARMMGIPFWNLPSEEEPRAK